MCAQCGCQPNRETRDGSERDRITQSSLTVQSEADSKGSDDAASPDAA